MIITYKLKLENRQLLELAITSKGYKVTHLKSGKIGVRDLTLKSEIEIDYFAGVKSEPGFFITHKLLFSKKHRALANIIGDMACAIQEQD